MKLNWRSRGGRRPKGRKNAGVIGTMSTMGMIEMMIGGKEIALIGRITMEGEGIATEDEEIEMTVAMDVTETEMTVVTDVSVMAMEGEGMIATAGEAVIAMAGEGMVTEEEGIEMTVVVTDVTALVIVVETIGVVRTSAIGEEVTDTVKSLARREGAIGEGGDKI